MNDIDTLMARIEEINALGADEVTPDDEAKLIEYIRQLRGKKASGEKPSRSGKMSIEDMIAMLPISKPSASAGGGIKLTRKL